MRTTSSTHSSVVFYFSSSVRARVSTPDRFVDLSSIKVGLKKKNQAIDFQCRFQSNRRESEWNGMEWTRTSAIESIVTARSRRTRVRRMSAIERSFGWLWFHPFLRVFHPFCVFFTRFHTFLPVFTLFFTRFHTCHPMRLCVGLCPPPPTCQLSTTSIPRRRARRPSCDRFRSRVVATRRDIACDFAFVIDAHSTFGSTMDDSPIRRRGIPGLPLTSHDSTHRPPPSSSSSSSTSTSTLVQCQRTPFVWSFARVIVRRARWHNPSHRRRRRRRRRSFVRRRRRARRRAVCDGRARSDAADARDARRSRTSHPMKTRRTSTSSTLRLGTTSKCCLNARRDVRSGMGLR